MSDVTGLACDASDVIGLCHRFGMWCIRCHRFMSQVWHVVHQMSQVYVTGLACGASDVTGLCHRFGMCASDVTGLACVMASVRQMSCHVMLKLPLAAADGDTEEGLQEPDRDTAHRPRRRSSCQDLFPRIDEDTKSSVDCLL